MKERFGELILDDMINAMFGFDRTFKTLPSNTQTYPKYNIVAFKDKEEDKDFSSFEIRVAVPGIHKDELSISMENDILNIKHKKEKTEVKEFYTVKGFSTQDFELALTIPTDYKIKPELTTLKDGILYIVFKKVEAKNNLIEIKIAD